MLQLKLGSFRKSLLSIVIAGKARAKWPLQTVRFRACPDLAARQLVARVLPQPLAYAQEIQSGNKRQEPCIGTSFRCLVHRGYASAAKGIRCSGRVSQLCAALIVEEVSPVLRHRLEALSGPPSPLPKS
jgi:hypothetical protein